MPNVPAHRERPKRSPSASGTAATGRGSAWRRWLGVLVLGLVVFGVEKFAQVWIVINGDNPAWGATNVDIGEDSLRLVSFLEIDHLPRFSRKVGTFQRFQGEIGNLSAFGGSVGTLLSGLYRQAISFNSPLRNVGLPPYLFPLPPSKHHIGDRSSDDRELCNDGKGFITGHWVLGIVLCVIGIWCSCRMYLMPDGYSDYLYFTRAFIWQGLFVVLFGFGVYAIISSTFKDCDAKPNAPAHGPLPNRTPSLKFIFLREVFNRCAKPQIY